MNTDSIRRLLNPLSVAIIGANDKNGYGGRTMRNATSRTYAGALYPVNPGRDEVMGYKCYPSVSAIGKPVDLAIVIVKAPLVVETVQECADAGVGGVLIITAGFREADPVNGPVWEAQLRQISEKTGMRIVGPNCLGLANTELDLWACALSTLPQVPIASGRCALISQSGATGFGPLLCTAMDRKVGCKYVITTGNETDLTMCDYIEYMIEDDGIDSIGVLIEGLKEVERFKVLARQAYAKGKTIIALKMGESDVGSRAAASHTASLTGSMEVFNALAKQCGVIKAQDYDELIELMKLTSMPKKLKGRRMAAFAGSGGISGFLGDLLAKNGFEIPVVTQETQDEINVYLKGFGSPRNPMDLTMHMRQPYLVDILNSIENHNEIDGYAIATNGSVEAMTNVVNAGNAIDKPVYFIWMGNIDDHAGLDVIRDAGWPISFSIQKFTSILKKVADRYCDLGATEDDLPGELPENLPSGFLNEVEAKDLIFSHGVQIPAHVTANAESGSVEGLDFACGKRYVGKVVSRNILHKSDIGGVVVGIGSEEQAAAACGKLKEAGLRSGETLEGLMFEEMAADGLDVVVGIRRDDAFGQVLMVGLGGIYTELFKMVSIRTLPVSEKEVDRMLDEIPGITKMMSGYRGQPVMDREELVKTIKALADLVSANAGRVKLLEINPLRVFEKGKGVCALDCVIELG